MVNHKTRILIVEDFPLMRAGIAKVLSMEPTFQVVGESETGGEALDLAITRYPDVILLDLNLPDISGVEVCKTLVKQQPAIKVIILTVSDAESNILECIRYGASGYLLKDIGPDMLIEAIKATCKWGYFMHPTATGKLIDGYGKLISEPIEPGCNLTDRETEILARVAEGCTNREIAEELFISEKTVKNHITNVFKKLKVNDRTEAVVHALKRRII